MRGIFDGAETMIDIKTGNPWEKDTRGKQCPASFSRFILPFSYHLEQIPPYWCKSLDTDKLFFQSFPASALGRERIVYFTRETANVLYERATWAKIPANIWQENKKCCGPFSFKSVARKREFQVSLAPPWLVLFEDTAFQHVSHSLMHHGFLILDAWFPMDKDGQLTANMDDMLEFNEMFRYYDQPFTGHADKYREALADFPAEFTSVQCKTSYPCSLYKQRWLSLLRLPLKKENCFLQIIPKKMLNSEQSLQIEDHISCATDTCFHYADNRAFVWTAAILPHGASHIANKHGGHIEKPWNSGHWLKLLNVDKPDPVPADTHQELTDFEIEWTKERTYKRWLSSGTWYGYSYHSGAMLASDLEEPPLWYHFGHLYFDQILLLIYLRVTLFAFSRRLTLCSQANDYTILRKRFSPLRGAFAQFTNLYQFPLISNQQQGVEMYAVARQSMDIDRLFKEVQEEITSTHEYLEMRATARLTTLGVILAFIGAFFTLTGIVVALTTPEILKNFLIDRATNDGKYIQNTILFDIFLLLAGGWMYWRNRPVWIWKILNKIRT